MKQVVLYTKAGCHLCEVVRRVILSVRPRVEFGYTEIDIESDPEIFEDYRYDVPVIEIDGRRAFKYRVEPDAFLERLRA